jgi:hypothetical protein
VCWATPTWICQECSPSPTTDRPCPPSDRPEYSATVSCTLQRSKTAIAIYIAHKLTSTAFLHLLLFNKFIDFEMFEEGDIDSERDKDSDYLDDVIDYDGSGSEESLDDCVEEKIVVREKKRKRTGGEGGRKNTASIERTTENKEGRKVEETDNIEVLLKGKVATVQDLFTRERKNIKVDGISYSSGIAIKMRHNKKIIEYRKEYRCLMVMNRRNKKEGWRILASHRDTSNKDYVGCKGRMEGFFLKDRYWFRMKHCHTCDKGGGSLDN